ncbi:MAG: response regulator [Bacteroidota bacterium]
MAQKILFAEDEQTLQSVVAFKLRNSGYEVFTVNNGAEALEFLKTKNADLIVSDIMMPVMSGKELIIELKKNDAMKKIPVILLTSRSLEKEVVEGLSLGADDYIKKPFSPSELVARVRNVLSRANPS